MLSLIARPTANLRRLQFGVDPRAISIAEGVRAALSVALIVAADEWLAFPPLMMAALAALLTCLCDSGGPMRRRVLTLLSFSVLGATVVMAFGLARNLGYAVIPLACFGIFCFAFVRIYSQATQQVGNLLTVVLVLSLDDPLPDLKSAGLLGFVFFCGSLWALLLTMVLWRVRPFLPVRRAVGRAFKALAVLTGDIRQVIKHPNPYETIWEEHARAHRRAVREMIEAARTTVLDTLRVRGGGSTRAAEALIRLETADQIFGAIIALSEMLEQAQRAGQRDQIAAVDRFLRLLRPMLLVIGGSIEANAPDRLHRVERNISAIAATVAALPANGLHAVADALVERLRFTISVAAPPGYLPGKPDRTVPIPLRERLLTPAMANLDRNSAAFRHALRSAVVAALGFSITFTWEGPYQHWLTIVMVMTMQPYFAPTLQRALERIGGTVLGGAMAAVIAIFATTPITMAAAIFPLAIISLSLRPASYGVFITFLTPMVVLLAEVARAGTSWLEIAAMRAFFTVLGGLLAVGGCIFLWPSWEPDRLVTELLAAIAAHGKFAERELSLLLGEASVDEVEQARRGAGMASNNLEASLSRALLEPHRRARGRLDAALAIDAALRRMAGRLSAMQLDRRPLLDASWRDWIGTAMDRLARADLAVLAPRPPAQPGHADNLLRIFRQIELISGALAKVEPPVPL